jgi:uncharacterized protein with PIN domain
MEIRKARENEYPKCPHCEREIKEVVVRQIDKKLFYVEKRQIYFCPHCRKTLGVGQLSHT